MEIARQSRERGTIIIAVVTFVVIGVSLVFSTWQNLRQQDKASAQHLELAARSVFQAVEALMRPGHMRSRQPGGPVIADYFRELEESGEVRFVGLFDEQGVRLMNTGSKKEQTLVLPPQALRELTNRGEWYGQALFGGKAVYIYGKQVRYDWRRTDHRLPMPLLDEKPPLLLVGLDMEKHLAVYRGFAHNAFFQAAYSLAAALFVWALAVSFLARRDLARRAVFLERFQANLLDILPDGLLTVDESGTVQFANPALHSIFGSEPGELAGKPLSSLPPGLALCLPETPLRPGMVDWRQLSFGGAQLEVLASAFQGESGETRLLIIRDRTRVHNLEKDLAQAEKLAAIGTLAAGVAHEIRNPLSALRGFAQYFAKKLSGRKPEEDYANTMLREADRLNRVITDLLYISRPRQIRPIPVDLAAVADEVRNLVRFELDERGVNLETDLEAKEVLADEDSLKQSLLNLVLNSLDALATPGADISPRLLLQSEQTEDGVRVSVQDSGQGMTPEQKAQAFEPFFTAKQKGTGLGLALVHKTMREHGGEARIDSEPGQGCRVTLFFPDKLREES